MNNVMSVCRKYVYIMAFRKSWRDFGRYKTVSSLMNLNALN